MTPADVRAARIALGMTQDQLATALRMGTDGKRAIRRWECGERPISGPATVALEAMLSGWRPRLDYLADEEAEHEREDNPKR